MSRKARSGCSARDPRGGLDAVAGERHDRSSGHAVASSSCRYAARCGSSSAIRAVGAACSSRQLRDETAARARRRGRGARSSAGRGRRSACCSRSRMLGKAVPLPRRRAEVRRRRRPRPSSSTVSTSEPPVDAARAMRTCRLRSSAPVRAGSRSQPAAAAAATAARRAQRRPEGRSRTASGLPCESCRMRRKADIRLELAPSVCRPARAGQRGTQVVNEFFEHRLRRSGSTVDERDHIGERVEQEVRLDLRLQQAQARFVGAVLGADLARLAAEELLEQRRDQKRRDDVGPEQVGAPERRHEARIELARRPHPERPADGHARDRHEGEVEPAATRRPVRQALAADGAPAEPERRSHGEADRQADEDVAADHLRPRDPAVADREDQADDAEERGDDEREDDGPEVVDPRRPDARRAVVEPRAPRPAQHLAGVVHGRKSTKCRAAPPRAGDESTVRPIDREPGRPAGPRLTWPPGVRLRCRRR